MANSFDRSKVIKLLISQAKTLEKNVNRSLNDTGTEAHSRYVNFKTYAEMFNNIAREAEKALGLPKNSFAASSSKVDVCLLFFLFSCESFSHIAVLSFRV